MMGRWPMDNLLGSLSIPHNIIQTIIMPIKLRIRISSNRINREGINQVISHRIEGAMSLSVGKVLELVEIIGMSLHDLSVLFLYHLN